MSDTKALGTTNMAVFLDRDGVINELIYHRDAGVIDTPFSAKQFKLLPEWRRPLKFSTIRE